MLIKLWSGKLRINTILMLLFILQIPVMAATSGRYTVSFDHTQKAPAGLPVWYLEPPTKAGYLIGLGAGESRVAALTVALSDLSRKATRAYQDVAHPDSLYYGPSPDGITKQHFNERSSGDDYIYENTSILFFGSVGISSRIKRYSLPVSGKSIPMFERFDHVIYTDGSHNYAVKSFRMGTEDDYISDLRLGSNNASLQNVIDGLLEFGLNIEILILYDADLFLARIEMKLDDIERVEFRQSQDMEVAKKLKELFNEAQQKPMIDNPDMYRKFLEQNSK